LSQKTIIKGRQIRWLYTWRCPLCNAVGNRKFSTNLIARRMCRKHFSKRHELDNTTNLKPIIEKIPVSDRKGKKFKTEKISKDIVWYEISDLPKFSVSPMNILIIPHHTFVRERIYRKILKQNIKS